MNNVFDIIVKPLMSEKSYEGIADKKYVFMVQKSATKTDIKRAIEEIFKVSVDSVNTMNCRGKLKRQGRTQGMTPSYKKAIIQLKSDSKSIDLFDSLA